MLIMIMFLLYHDLNERTVRDLFTCASSVYGVATQDQRVRLVFKTHTNS